MKDYDTTIAICAALRQAGEKVKHYKDFTKRVENVFKAALPGYSVFVRTEQYKVIGSYHSITVYGNGIEYNERVSVHWHWYAKEGEHWHTFFLEALAIKDPTDSKERETQEETLTQELTYLAASAQGLQDQLDAVRAEALNSIAALPIPSTATVRNKSIYWDKPGHALTQRFPILFEKKEE